MGDERRNFDKLAARQAKFAHEEISDQRWGVTPIVGTELICFFDNNPFKQGELPRDLIH